MFKKTLLLLVTSIFLFSSLGTIAYGKSINALNHGKPFKSIWGKLYDHEERIADLEEHGSSTLDKQIRFSVSSGRGTLSSSGWTNGIDEALIKFNVYNYADINEAYLVALIRTRDSNTRCFVDLVNITDNIVISSSLVETNSTDYEWVESGNIIDELPNKEISLAIRIRSEKDGVLVEVRSANLFLYRN